MVKKKTFNGRSPRNARIKIDYSGKRPDVKFSYPRGRHGYVGSMLPVVKRWCYTISMILLIFGLFFTNIVISILGVDTVFENNTYDYIQRNITFEDNNQTEIIYTNINLTLMDETLSKEGLRKRMINAFNISWVYVLCFVLIYFGTPYLIYLPFKKQWDSLFPKYMAWCPFGDLKYMKFEPKDVKDGHVKVSLFSNVVLKYNAKGDFSKYLDWMEIEEHKFQYLRGSVFGKKKKEKNEWLWYCRFFLKEKPKNGSLEVWFK